MVVEPQAVDVAFPGRDGAFALSLPAGDYTLKAYFDGRQVGRTVAVTAKDKGLVDLKDPLSVNGGAEGKSAP